MSTGNNRVSRRRNLSPSNPEYVAFEEIRDTDCLFGRGKNRMHIGNVAFRALVRSRVDHYQEASSRGYRVRIIIEALTSIHDAGGRMLRLHDGKDKIWIAMDRECARDKVGDSIRDIIKTRKRRKIPEAPRNDIVSSLDETVTFGTIMNLLTCDIDKRLKKTSKKKRYVGPVSPELRTNSSASLLETGAASMPDNKHNPRLAQANTASVLKQPDRHEMELLRQRESKNNFADQAHPLHRSRDASFCENSAASATEIIIPVGQNDADVVQSLYQQRLQNARSMYSMDQALSNIVHNRAQGQAGDTAGLSRFQRPPAGSTTDMRSQAQEEARNAALRRSGSRPSNAHEDVISDSAKRLAAALEMQRVAQVEIERETRLLSEAHAGSAEGSQGIAIRDLLLKQQRPAPHQATRLRPSHPDTQDYLMGREHVQGPPPRLNRDYYDPIQELLLTRTRAARLRPPGAIGTHESQDQWLAAQATARDRELIAQLTRRGNFEELLAEARALENSAGRGAGFGAFPPQYPPFHHTRPPYPTPENHGKPSVGTIKNDAKADNRANQRSTPLTHMGHSQIQGMARPEGFKPASSNGTSGQQPLDSKLTDRHVETTSKTRPFRHDVSPALIAGRQQAKTDKGTE